MQPTGTNRRGAEMRAYIFAAGIVAASLAGGCTQFPDLDRAVSDAAMAARFPRLAPLDALPDAAAVSAGPVIVSDLAARNAALRGRADTLRNAPLDPAPEAP